MKENEAPEKIYLIRNLSTPTSLNTTNDCRQKYLQEWYKGREKDTDIEYTRTDAFIEKAVKHIDGLVEFLNEFGHQLKKERIIEEFKKYMEGE